MTNHFRNLASHNFHQIQESSNSLPDYFIHDAYTGKQGQLPEIPDWGDINSFCNYYGFYTDYLVEEQLFGSKDQQPSGKQDRMPHNPDNGRYSPEQHTPEYNGVIQGSFVQDPIDSSKTKYFGDEENTSEGSQKLSTEQILRLAGERFVQFSSQKFIINIKRPIHHPNDSSLTSLSPEDKQEVELAQLLLAAAEKVSYRQYDRAGRLLVNCQWIVSCASTPLQRTVSFFCEALIERIRKETEISKEERVKTDACQKRNLLSLASMHQRLPFFQVIQFTAVQAFMEAVKTKQKIHFIDFQILTGMHWPALTQNISDQKLDPSVCLKITAIETMDKSMAEATGKQLQSFASNLNLHFIYKVIFLPDIKDLKEEHLDIEPVETVAVYFHFMVRTLISKPNSLKNLMGVTKKIKPSVVVVGEVEANHNSPSFVNRFIEALFYYGALFDSLEEGMRQDKESRISIETGIFREGIHNIVSCEGYERVTRSVSITVWRAFFARFGMIELELSSASLHQAYLIMNKFDCGGSCTLDISSKCLLVGWKGTPFFSVSAWKFH